MASGESADAELSGMNDLNLKEEPETAPASSAPAHPELSSSPPPQPIYTPPISNNAPNFRYKYPGAKPTPPGVDDTEWNKIYTAADSRFYNKHGKNSLESKKYRDRGETYTLALKMLEEKREKRAREEAGLIPPPKKKVAVKRAEPPAAIKHEPMSISRDATPNVDGMAMGIAEKIKSQGRARKPAAVPAPLSDRGTPAPSTAFSAPSPPKSGGSKDNPVKKKGTALPVKKAPPKLKSFSKSTHAPKIEGSSVTPATSRRPSHTPGPRATSSEDGTDDGGEYCICRGPDDHRMMVNCEGGCDDWYHCSCVGIDEVDTKELLDRYVCPKCSTDTKFTTWKPMCRYGNVGRHIGIAACRKAARVGLQPNPSKYCSEEHKVAFWLFVKSKVRDDDEPSKGGALNQGEVGWLLSQCKTAEEVHELGSKPRLSKKEDAVPDRAVGLDYLTVEEEKEIEEIKQKKAIIEKRIEGYQNHQKVLHMINKRSKIASQQPNLEVKDLCGYDNRLAMNETEFFMWCESSEGKAALESGTIGPRTAETKHLTVCVPYPGQILPESPNVPDALNNLCLRARKKCKHLNWRDLHNTEFVYNQKILKEELAKLERTESQIVDDAETREATKGYYSNNTTEQLF